MSDKLEIKLNDIADELLILDKTTVDNLFKLEDPIYCIGLYLFYYKTAKWQKTNIVKANDIYARKCLKIGKDKLQKIKGILKKNGLINIVQRRENGKISGWFVELHYIVSKQRMEDIKIKVDDESNNPQIQQVENSTSSIQETNALRKQLNALRRENEMLKENIKKNNKKKVNKKQYEQEFEEIWKLYPKKVGKSVALSKYIKARQDGVDFETVKNGVKRYAEFVKGKDEQYIRHGKTWFNQKGWDDEYNIKRKTKQEIKDEEELF